MHVYIHVYIHEYIHVYIHVYIHRFSDMESPAAETTTMALQHSNTQVKYIVHDAYKQTNQMYIN